MVKQAGNQGGGTRSDSKARGCESTHFPPPLAATEFSSPQVVRFGSMAVAETHQQSQSALVKL